MKSTVWIVRALAFPCRRGFSTAATAGAHGVILLNKVAFLTLVVHSSSKLVPFPAKCLFKASIISESLEWVIKNEETGQGGPSGDSREIASEAVSLA